MKTAIIFREGHSGNFLYSVLTNLPANNAKFRMADKFQNYRDNFFLTHQEKTIINNPTIDCFLKILPSQNIYNPIYNIFMKKTLIEEFPDFDLSKWVNDTVFWYDKCYYQIQCYYKQICNDICTNTLENVVDFDRLTDCDYLEELLLKYFNQTLNDNQRALAENYARLQLQVELKDDNTTSMLEILGPITDDMLLSNPWFWAYAVFKFEHNNNLTEQQRLWSVDHFRSPQTRADLLQYQYSL
jgi:hypothetical protein